MSRSLKKGPYIEKKLFDKVLKAKQTADRRPIKTWSRRSTITPECIGLSFAIYNGKTFVPVFVSEDMVGHKFGEFSPTRIFRAHGSHTEKPVTKT
ncbi:MAG: 30S ribosomal protein S19 [Candidatus Omnitrophica bacterium]|nr:30S ribosomal protein S19 [Candidatus Omnitrophota bacterium]